MAFTVPVPFATKPYESEEKPGIPGLDELKKGPAALANVAGEALASMPMNDGVSGGMHAVPAPVPPIQQMAPTPPKPAAPPPVDVSQLQFVDPMAAQREQAAAVAAVGPDTRTQRTVRSKEETAALAEGKQLAAETGTLAQTHATQVKGEIDAEAKARRAEDQSVNAEVAEKRKKLEVQRVANKAGQKHIDGLIEETSKKRMTDLWEDKGTGAHILAVLSAGIGQFATALTGGPNAALGIINSAMDRHRQKQLDDFQKSKEFIALKQSSQDRANQALAERRVELDAEEAGRWRAVGRERDIRLLQSGATAERRKADVIKLAAMQHENDKAQRSAEGLRSIVTTDNSAQNATRRQMAAGGAGGSAPKYEERRDAEGFKQTAEQMARLRDLAMKHPEAFAEYQKAIREDKAVENSPTGIKQLRRMAGPLDVADRLKNLSPEAREFHSLSGTLIAAKAREMDDKGSLTDSGLAAGRDNLALHSITPKELAKMANEYEKKFMRRAESAVADVGRPAAAEIAGTIDFIKRNPTDPRVPAMVAALRAQGAVR